MDDTLNKIKLQISQTDESGNTTDAQTIEIENGQRLTLDFSLGINLSREGEQPAKVAPAGEDLIVQWEDGSYVILEAMEGAVVDPGEPRAVSINGVTVTGFGNDLDRADLDNALRWTANYEDSPLPWAPLPPYQVPWPEPENVDPIDLEEEPEVPVIEIPITPAAARIPVPAPKGEENQPPVIGEASVRVSEEGLENALPDQSGSQDTTDAHTISGTIPVSDPDGDPITVTLNAPLTGNLVSNGVPVTWTGGGTQTLVGTAGNTTVVTITIDNAGNFTVVLGAPVHHANPNVEDEKSFGVGVTVSDGSETAEGQIGVTIEDDSPMIYAVEEGEVRPDEMTVDETFLAVNDSANFSGEFISAYGADDAGSISYGLGISASGANSGLTDTLSNQAVLLSMNGAVVEGRAGSGGPLVFTVSVDSVTGEVTLDQLRAIIHPDPNNHDESRTLLSADLVTFNAAIVDSDGDTDTAALNIGHFLNFKDDGPSIEVEEISPADTFLVDETVLSADASHDFADNFSGAFDAGEDGQLGDLDYELVLGSTSVGSGLHAHGAAGAKGSEILMSLNSSGQVVGAVGGTTYFVISVDALGEVTFDQQHAIWHDVPGTSHDEPDTLDTTNASDLQIKATITDKDLDTASATLNLGQDVFTIEDDGPRIAEEWQSSPDTFLVDETDLGTNAEHSFDDNFSGAFEAGEDDQLGPLDYELVLGSSSVGSGLHAHAADGSQGTEILMSLNSSGHVVGAVGGTTYFVISVDALGEVTFDQQHSIWHDEPGATAAKHDEPDTLDTTNASDLQIKATITDQDLDTASATVNLGQDVFTIEDDGPSIDAEAILAADTLEVDDTTLGVPGQDTANFADNFTPALDAGEDGQLSVGYSLELDGPGTGSGLYAHADDGARGVEIMLNQSGNVVTGTVTDTSTGTPVVTPYFTISINAVSGVVTFTQSAAIWHDVPGTSHNELLTLSTDNADDLQVKATLTDGDKDVATGTIDVGAGVFGVRDDGPSITPEWQGEPDTFLVDETNLSVNDSKGFANNFDGAFDAGEDGELSTAYSLVLNGTGDIGSGLHAHAADGSEGTEILLSQSGNTITGSVGSTDYFTISINSVSGLVTFDQENAIWHDLSPDNHDEPLTLTAAAANTIQVKATLTDGDKDVVSATIDAGTGVFTIEDDGPSIDAEAILAADTLEVDDTTLGVPGQDTANFADNFTPALDAGEDGQLSVGYSLELDGPGTGSGLYAHADDGARGVEIMLNQSGNVVTGTVTDTSTGTPVVTPYFTISINAVSGVVTFTQSAAIWHDVPGTSHNELLTLSTDNADDLQVKATLTDGDKDVATGTIDVGAGVFGVRDDGPSITPEWQGEPDTFLVDETNLSVNDSKGFANNFDGAFDAGEDGELSTAYSLVLNGTGDIGSGLHAHAADGSEGTEILLSQSGNTITGSVGSTDYFTISINSVSGLVTFDQENAIWHDLSPDNHDEPLTLTAAAANTIQVKATLTDGDKDVVSATIDAGTGVFTIEDDGPSIDAEAILAADTLEVDDTTLGVPGQDTANFADNFTPALDAGEDGQLSVGYSLELDGPGTGSGLYAHADDGARGVEIMLNQSGNVVTGTVTDTSTGTPVVTPYFTISINAVSGVVTFTQSAAIWHDVPGTSHNELLTLSTDNADDLQVKATLTDGDKDVATGTIDVGAGVFGVRDDGPSITPEWQGEPDTFLVDETNLSVNDSKGFANNFDGAFDAGEDGELSTAYSLVLNGTGDIGSGLHAHAADGSEGTEILLSQSGNTITGSVGSTDYFTISINSVSGLVTFDQENAIWHDLSPDNHDEPLTLTAAAANTIQVKATLTDGDKDVVSATIDAGTGVFTIEDDGPSIDAEAILAADTLEVDDTTLGVPGQDTANFADNFTPALDAGEDGQLSVGYSLELDGPGTGSGLYAHADDGARGVEIMLNQSGNVVTGTVTDTSTGTPVVTPYFTISINAVSGVVTFTQSAAIWHDVPGTSHNELLTLSTDNADDLQVKATLTDGDKDVATGTIDVGAGVFGVRDDGPSITPEWQGEPDTFLVDETNLSVNDSKGFANNFDGAFDAGEDGELSTAYSLVLNGTGDIGSGLHAHAADGSEGTEILLSQSGNTITGSVGSTDYFTISINSVSGLVTFDQENAIWHDLSPDNHDEPLTLTAAAANTIQVKATLTDGDKDVVSATIDAGTGVFTIEDDGPSIDAEAILAADTLEVDDTTLGVPGQDTANFADNFTPALDAGEDGQLSVGYSLELDGPGTGSGLYAHADDGARGVEIMLNQSGNVVTGTVTDTSTGTPVVTPYFTISINAVSGVVTFTQSAAIWHDVPGTSHNELLTLSTDNADDLQVKATLTDGDKDVATGTIDVGAGVFGVRDDGPSITPEWQGEPDTFLVDETNLSVNDSKGFANNFSGAFDAGEDGELSTAYSLVLNGTGDIGSGLHAHAADGSEGTEILLSQSGNTITGSVGSTDYFTISINSVSGLVTFDQENAIWHDLSPDNHDEPLTLTAAAANTIQVKATLTDGDKDVVSATIDAGTGVFTIEDDGPSIDAEAILAADTLEVDDTTLGVPGQDTANFADNFTPALDAGEDGQLSVGYSLELDGPGTGSGLYAHADDGARGVEIMLNQSGNVVTGTVTDTSTGTPVVTPYFTISINAVSGVVTFTQSAAIWHDVPGTSHNELLTLSTDNADDLQVKATLTDGDKDVATGTIDVGAGVFGVRDDGPSITPEWQGEPDTFLVDETNLSVNDSKGFANNFSGAFDAGEDGELSTAYSLVLNGTGDIGSGLHAHAADGSEGTEILLSQSGNTITGSVGSTDYFTISINSVSGLVTFDQENAIWHDLSPDNHDEPLTLTAAAANTIQVKATLTDGDKDVVSATIDAGTGVFTIEDDGPSIDAEAILAADTLVVDETDLSVDDSANFADNFSGAFDPGADGQLGDLDYELVLSGTNVGSGLHAHGIKGAQGSEILLNQAGDTVTGAVGGITYFTISIDTVGLVTFDQQHAIWHNVPGTSHDEPLSLTTSDPTALQVKATITDQDLDTASATLNLGQDVFTIEDDGPCIIIPQDAALMNEPGSWVVAALDIDLNIDDNVGADQLGRVQFTNITNGQESEFTSEGRIILLYLNDDMNVLSGRTDGETGPEIFRVTLQQDGSLAVSDDTYQIDVFAQIDNGAGIGFADLSGTGPAGNPPWKAVESGVEGQDILFTPINAGSVNSDVDDVAVDSQFIAIDSGLRIDFADVTVHLGGNGKPNDYTFENHNTVNSFSFNIDQVSNGTYADIELKAFFADDDQNLEGDPQDLLQQITQVEVYDGSGTQLAVATGDGTIGGLEFDFDATGAVTVRGLLGDYQVVTVGQNGYNRIEVLNVGTESDDGKFSLSHLETRVIISGEPVEMSYDLLLLDADDDTAGGQLSFVLNPPDDSPLAEDDNYLVDEAGSQTLNAMFILDRSGSMRGNPIELAKSAILDFAGQPGVLSVLVLPFGAEANAPSAWFDLTANGYAELQTFLNPIGGTGKTNYEDAVYDAEQSWTTPPNVADINNIYFVSDGEPTVRSNNGVNDEGGSMTNDRHGLTEDEVAAWTDFATDNGIDNVFAIGIGAGPADADLQTVGFPDDAPDGNVIRIYSAGDLDDTFAETLPSTITGNILYDDTDSDGIIDDFGDDGAHPTSSIESITIDGVQYNYDGTQITKELPGPGDDPITGSVLNVTTTLQGELEFDFSNGDFTYEAPVLEDDDGVESFTYVIKDTDGDTDDGLFEIMVNDVPETTTLDAPVPDPGPDEPDPTPPAV